MKRSCLIFCGLLALVSCNEANNDCAQVDSGCSPLVWNLLYLFPERNSPVYMVFGNTASSTAISYDAVNWNINATGTAIPLVRGFYGGPYFLGSGSDSQITYSTDGFNWSSSGVLSTNDLPASGFFKDQLLAGGQDGTPNAAVYRSTDGVNWSSSSITSSTGFETIAASNDLAVACGGDGTIICAYSRDGATWTESTPAGISHLKSSTYFGGTFFFASLAAGGNYATTTDGSNWTIHKISDAGAAQFLGVATDGHKLVFGDFTAPGIHILNKGAYHFEALPGPSFGVAYAGGTFVATGGSTGGNIYYSGDAYNWTTVTVGTENWFGAVAGLR